MIRRHIPIYISVNINCYLRLDPAKSWSLGRRTSCGVQGVIKEDRLQVGPTTPGFNTHLMLVDVPKGPRREAS